MRKLILLLIDILIQKATEQPMMHRLSNVLLMHAVPTVAGVYSCRVARPSFPVLYS